MRPPVHRAPTMPAAPPVGAPATPANETPIDKDVVAYMALDPSMNCAGVVRVYKQGALGHLAPHLDMAALTRSLKDASTKVNQGDLTDMESMLITQAAALQAMFTHLATSAKFEKTAKQFETSLLLALKCQAQSRATILAIAELKFPRQVAFIKQNNVAHGPQQVNNGTAPAPTTARAEKPERTGKDKLLVLGDGSKNLDSGTAAKATGGDRAMETVGVVHRAAKSRR